MGSEETVNPQPGHPKRDFWDKANIILGPVATLMTAVTIALVSYIASGYLNKNQENEAKTRLYTELMSRREESESALRKDMFTSIINSILSGGDATSSIDEKILQLELLAYNFHESLNLTPLFTYLDRKNNSDTEDPKLRTTFKERLYRMSREVTNKQIASLDGVSKIEKFNYCYDTVNCAGMDQTFSCVFQDSVRMGDHWDSITHVVRLTILNIDSFNRSLEVRLTICTQIPGKEDKCANPAFTIDFFEFPMIDNTRLINDKRCAVVMRDFDTVNKFIEMDLIFFPGSHSSLKERPYYDDIVAKLLPGRGGLQD
ncbi:MAG TPA: hypothetical protein VFG10_02795 [Saprospiraceae bacterium]|nr:hypothetical protein [Saprospiraceae bacterium]